MRSRSAQGFTLIELVLVMGMLAIVLAVSLPSLRGFFRGRHLDSEARRFLSLTRYAHSRAVSEGFPMVLWIDSQVGSYGLQAQTGYLETDEHAVTYDLQETLEMETAPASFAANNLTAVQRNEMNAITGNLPAIRFMPDGFIAETSPEFVAIRQDDEDALWIVRSANRLSYEIQTSEPQLVRR